ncbi:hypothetical protein [Actinacidiphila sp. ITFR-21]|uniref:hypothetical protein n=1 Tax=Actinacidiphila sp. ITFR-21 TaxID=3075199 RepID=UPI00288A62A5|nr:hypothetical protein [Streptomyces sp. ITFR-21]WNI17684.1 hypothetical protein RLT57_20555 [Streptomyces sp. ITFR-21]WNI17824.1 hypothetical protein RLT57_21270 [Streptomyces sp. ITFR-21]
MTSSVEYGIFTPEGCIEASMWSPEEAERRAGEYRAEAVAEDVEETYTVHEMCEDHRDAEQPKNGCEECAMELAADGD